MRWYSAREVANALGLHPRTVRRHVQRGNLVPTRSPSGYFMTFSTDAIREWLTRHVVQTAKRYPPTLSPSHPNQPTQQPEARLLNMSKAPIRE
jgi:IS30 family transposase